MKSRMNTLYRTPVMCARMERHGLKPDEGSMLLLASPSHDRLHDWEQALQGFGSVLAIDQADGVRTRLLNQRAQILVLDLALPGLGTPKAIAHLRNLGPGTDIVILGEPLADEMEMEFFKVGVRGYCRLDINPQLLKRVVAAIQLGELWVRRSLMSRLLDQRGARSSFSVHDTSASIGRLAYLTEREREIARLVGSGGTNKQIARYLAISERTVKAHLTEIFRKLGITDRLKLALLLASTSSA